MDTESGLSIWVVLEIAMLKIQNFADEKIEAYVDLLAEMESAGDKLLVEGEIPKSYKDSAA